MNAVELVKQNAGAIALLSVAVAVFAGAYYHFTQNLPERENLVNGVRVLAKGPVKAGIAELLVPRVIPMQVVFTNSSDNLPCKIPMQSEVIYALAQSRKEAALQLRVREEEQCETRFQNKTEKTACTRPRLVIENGECDCVRLDRQNEVMLIRGSEEWLCSNAVNVRELIKWGLQ